MAWTPIDVASVSLGFGLAYGARKGYAQAWHRVMYHGERRRRDFTGSVLSLAPPSMTPFIAAVAGYGAASVLPAGPPRKVALGAAVFGGIAGLNFLGVLGVPGFGWLEKLRMNGWWPSI